MPTIRRLIIDCFLVDNKIGPTKKDINKKTYRQMWENLIRFPLVLKGISGLPTY